jgi:pimeloyl-ACP methyl ester carboxylesterase
VKQLEGSFEPGTLQVPEDWDHPESSGKIDVFYYVRKARTEAGRNRPPVVFYNGGPGSDSHGSAALLDSKDFSQDVDFIFIDQRGTGCSSQFPSDKNEATVQRLKAWGSRGIVGDSEAVRKHLYGNRKWRAFGQSFGGFVVHRYLEVSPEGLDRGIAHGASLMSDAADWLVERIRSQKRVGDSYFEKFPNDREIIKMAQREIHPDHCWESGDTKACGPMVLDSLTIMLGFQSQWPSLHSIIKSLRNLDGSLNTKTLELVVQRLVFGVYGSGGLAGNVISKMELAPGYDDYSGCVEVMKRLREAGENPDAYEINECRLLGGMKSPYPELVKNVSAQPISLPKLVERLSAPSAPLFYLFSGQQDVFVPYATFDEEVRTLGSLVRYKSFPLSGHEGFYSEEEVTNSVVQP